MSTEHRLVETPKGEGYTATEQSCRVAIGVDYPYAGYAEGPALDYEQLITMIMHLVGVASYISDDPQATLKRFNLDYPEINARSVRS